MIYVTRILHAIGLVYLMVIVFLCVFLWGFFEKIDISSHISSEIASLHCGDLYLLCVLEEIY